MINLFQFASNDQSLNYLSQIFGSMNGIIPSGTVGGSISLLGTMFKTFNSVVLIVGVLVVVYAVVIGVIKTAHEGEFMGKQGSNIWIPIRIVLGIAALVPSGSGYSGLQIFMMWVIVQGIGAADTVWNTALSYVNITGSPYAQLTIPSSNAAYAMGALFKGLVCDATAKENAADPTGTEGAGYYCNQHNDPTFCSGAGTTGNNFDSTAGSFAMGPGGSCGTLKYCVESTACSGSSTANANSIQCAACKGQINALKDIVPTLSSVAIQFRDADYTYRDFYANSYSPSGQHSDWSWIYNYCSANGIAQSSCCVGTSAPAALMPTHQGKTCQASGGSTGKSSGFPSPNGKTVQSASDEAVNTLYWPYKIQPEVGGNFLNTAVNYYMDQVTSQVTSYIAQQGQNSLNGWYADAQSTGWILAGGYYYYIAKMNDNDLKNAIPPLTMVGTNPNTTSEMGKSRNNFDAADALTAAAFNASSSNMFSSTPALAGYGAPLNATMKNVSQAFTASASTSGSPLNPLVQLQTMGTVMTTAAMLMFPILLYVSFGLALAANIDIWAEGYGFVNPYGPAISLSSMLLFPVLFGLLGLLITFGGLLSVYTPLIPYIFFTLGAIGWLISTIEAMVAGPLVALGILSPTQHGHDIFGKAEPAIMMLFSIFLRPGLMIFGLMASILLAGVVVGMINDAFWSVVVVGIESMAISTGSSKAAATAVAAASLASDPITMLLFLVAYITLCIIALNKSFAVIYLIPQGAVAWIGGRVAEAGETEAVGTVKGALQQTEGKVTGAMSKGVEVAKTAGAKAGEVGTKLAEKGKETAKGVTMKGKGGG